MAGIIKRYTSVVQLAALVPLLLVLLPMGRVAGQADKTSTEKRTSVFELAVTTNEVPGCLTRWSLTLTSTTENTDQGGGPTRSIRVTGNVLRSASSPSGSCTRQERATLSANTVPLSPAGISVFNVDSNAIHITLKGAAELQNNDINNVADQAYGRATFNIDTDCAVPQNPPNKTSITNTINGVKTTTTSSSADCSGSIIVSPTIIIPGPAFNPDGLLTVKFNDNFVLDWKKLVRVDKVVMRYYYEKVVRMAVPKSRRMLRAA
ncbi:hypothetical protein HYH02_001855 [Chlamydomonas schloesseri]|uniref:Uncharacterized protein n=1 Tax=Chlamydomonas schloesseri TaxID=2026947 RepID=A0A835WTE3_9CHLO|nr:hypothetical protein HYH02_001855 [Chlamydomonas schloesseri]|eukprot:KAG2453642.1 hypothetical protein HYH02_001855 [Chlamydomonas schloesseri]